MYNKLLNTRLWVLRSPEEEQGGSQEVKLEETDAFKSLKSSLDLLTKELSGIKEENKSLKTELASTKQELKDTRDAYKDMFGENSNTSKDEIEERTTSIDLLEEVAKCELK